MLLSVIVPARNEAGCLGSCLESLVAQSEEIFTLGDHWELLVVDDHSTDSTREIALGFPRVTVLEPKPLAAGWTGKANACWAGALRAQGEFLLFTDADTEFQPGSLLAAVYEAQRRELGLLSIAPRQIVSGFWQRAVMPLIFSELAYAYPPRKVNDPESEIAGAIGQFLLFSREAYFAVGGHEAVKSEILEDMCLARLIKEKKRTLRFRYGPEVLSARMYRTTEAMIEGWTKNLALLFPNALVFAGLLLLDIALMVGLPFLIALYFEYGLARYLLLLLWLRTLLRFYTRRKRADFSFADRMLSFLGIPLFILLLCRSWYFQRVKKQVLWKGRSYST